MVRRRLLSSSAKQASMSAYQNFWQRPPLVLATPQYGHSMSHRLGGAAATLSPSSRQPEQRHLPLQRDLQAMWDGGGGANQGTGALLKPAAFIPAFSYPGYQQVPTRAVNTLQPQSTIQYQQGNVFNYPSAVQMHQMSLNQQRQQPFKPVPVGILKKTSHVGGSLGAHNVKRVTIKAPARFQAPSVEMVKFKPEVPPKPSKGMRRQYSLKREQQKLLQQQKFYQKQLQKRQQEIKELHRQEQEHRKQQQLQRKFKKNQEFQKELQKQQEHQQALQKKLQHQKELQKQQETQKVIRKQQHLLEQPQLRKTDEQSNYFNIGKVASSILENYNTSYQETKKSLEKPEVPRKNVKANREEQPRFKDLSDLENESSTITLTTEQCQAGCPSRSVTSMVDKATNTQIDPWSQLLKQVPLTATSTMDKGTRKININELLRSEQVKGLKADPMCLSLTQLVALMCENQAEQDMQSRLRAGSGGDDGGHRKQYSVYLMVSPEDEGEGEPQVEMESTRSTIGNEASLRKEEEEEFLERCGNVYQEEHPSPRLGSRKRTRKRLDLDYFSSGALPFLPTRRPLHWPKPDYSKPSQGRPNRSRTSFRRRSRPSSKQLLRMHSQRSLSPVLSPKGSWKLWEDLPLTAKTLNKAYRHLWTLSGGQSCTTF